MRVVSLHFGGPICLAGGHNNSFFKCPTKNTAADALYTGDWHHFYPNQYWTIFGLFFI